MSLAKVIEVLAESSTSFDDAAVQAVKGAAKTVKNIKHVYIKDMQASVENNEIVKYKVNAKITFVVGE